MDSTIWIPAINGKFLFWLESFTSLSNIIVYVVVTFWIYLSSITYYVYDIFNACMLLVTKHRLPMNTRTILIMQPLPKKQIHCPLRLKQLWQLLHHGCPCHVAALFEHWMGGSQEEIQASNLEIAFEHFCPATSESALLVCNFSKARFCSSITFFQSERLTE